MLKQLMTFSFLFFAATLQAKTIVVKNAKELSSANAVAKPGDIVLLQNGTWQDIDIELTCIGTATQPITFKAATNGQVFIKGSSSLRLGGKFIVVEGLVFTEGHARNGSVWEFRKDRMVANNCRITNCMIKGFNNINRKAENYWVAFYGQHNRIDHCNFSDKTNLGVLMAVILDDDRSRLNSHSIDSNYFGYRKPLGSNSGEMIRVGVSQHCTFYSNTIIRNNLFEYCDGETEIVSIKSCGNVVRNNVFKECQGAVVLRHGNNNTVEGNIFWGNGKVGTGGVRVINEGNWIVNNYFFRCAGKGFRSPLAVMNGVFNSPPNRYLPVRDAVIANNTFFDCTPFSLGEGSDTERTVQPKNVYIFNNIFYNPNDTTLCYISSPVDSIFIANNFTSSRQQTSLPKGFEKTKVGLKKWDSYDYPAVSAKSIDILPAAFKEQENKRLLGGWPENAGCGKLDFFMSLYGNAKKMGIGWKETEKAKEGAVKAVNCSNAASVYAALSGNSKRTVIQLTGSAYFLDKPFVIDKDTRIVGSGREISFSSDHNLLNLFELNGSSSLTIDNLHVKLDTLGINYFIITDSSGSCSHYTVRINNCRFSGSYLTAFFYGSKNSYADEISVSNTTFSNIEGALFNLSDENDNKGFYNTEKMVISDCVFENNTGNVVNLYRGGNDESTMGPYLVFSKNILTNCSAPAQEALIHLFGTQRSELEKNIFTNCNGGKTLILYEDLVRAEHTLKNNRTINSGSIVTDKFVYAENNSTR